MLHDPAVNRTLLHSWTNMFHITLCWVERYILCPYDRLARLQKHLFPNNKKQENSM